MAITWYSLELIEQQKRKFACAAERHQGQGIEAEWVEQLLDLEIKKAYEVWYTCAECHQAMKIIQEEDDS